MYIVAVPTPYDKDSKKIDATYVVNAVKSVMEVSEKRPVGVVDRGGDDIALLNWFLDENYQMVVRIKPEMIIPVQIPK